MSLKTITAQNLHFYFCLRNNRKLCASCFWGKAGIKWNRDPRQLGGVRGVSGCSPARCHPRVPPGVGVNRAWGLSGGAALAAWRQRREGIRAEPGTHNELRAGWRGERDVWGMCVCAQRGRHHPEPSARPLTPVPHFPRGCSVYLQRLLAPGQHPAPFQHLTKGAIGAVPSAWLRYPGSRALTVVSLSALPSPGT